MRIYVRVPAHQIHACVNLMDGSQKQILFSCPSKCLTDSEEPSKSVAVVPVWLMYNASWIYDFTTNQIIKNKTKHGVVPVPVLDAEEVDKQWLVDNRLAFSMI